jgi:thioredoxin 1
MASEAIKHLNDENFAQETENGLILVDFFAEWCGPCKMLAPVLDEVANEMEGAVTVAKLDIDHAQNTTQSFDVTSVPTLILFKDGAEIQRVVGLKDKDTLKQMIQGAAS